MTSLPEDEKVVEAIRNAVPKPDSTTKLTDWWEFDRTVRTTLATIRQEEAQKREEEREQVLSKVVNILENIHYPWSMNGGTHIDRKWAIKIISNEALTPRDTV